MEVVRLIKVGRRLIILVLALYLTGSTSIPVASAKEPAAPEISLNQAIVLAVGQSGSVQKAEKDIDWTKALRDNASDSLGYTPASGLGVIP